MSPLKIPCSVTEKSVVIPTHMPAWIYNRVVVAKWRVTRLLGLEDKYRIRICKILRIINAERRIHAIAAAGS